MTLALQNNANVLWCVFSRTRNERYCLFELQEFTFKAGGIYLEILHIHEDLNPLILLGTCVSIMKRLKVSVDKREYGKYRKYEQKQQ